MVRVFKNFVAVANGQKGPAGGVVKLCTDDAQQKFIWIRVMMFPRSVDTNTMTVSISINNTYSITLKFFIETAIWSLSSVG